MMEHSSSFRLIVRYLLGSEDYLDLYSLHEKYCLSPGQILDATTWLKDSGYIDQIGLKARLTAAGRDWLIAERFSVFQTKEKPWEEVPEGLTIERVLPNEPYMPDLSQVQRGFFLKR